MKRPLSRTLFTALALLMIFSAQNAHAKEKITGIKITPKSAAMLRTFGQAWINHIFWVRNVVMATKDGNTAAAKVAEENVVSNARQIAGAIKPFYGKKASDRLFELLAGHYKAIKAYMEATFAKNRAAQNAAMREMKKNVVEIADFLSAANPKNWPRGEMISALDAHVAYHMDQINQIAANDYKAEAKTWQDMENQVIDIAMVLGKGLIRQFPKKFEH